MVMVKESHTHQQFSAWNSPGLDHLPRLQLDQCIPPSSCTANVALPEYSVSILPGSNPGNQDVVDAFLKLPPLNCDVPHGTGNLYSKDSQCALLNRLGVAAKPSVATCAQKRFLIFDQSGNKTRLFFSSSFSHHCQIVASKIPACANGSYENPAAQVDEHLSVSPTEEKWDENQLTDGEDDMLEDSEEIDALLYSDGEEEYEEDGGGGGGENDEVTSTGHTTYITEDVYRKHKLFEKLDEEVASSDDLPKRRKLFDGGFNRPSLLEAGSPTKLDSSSGYEDDVESSNAGMRNCSDDMYSSKREKKIKVREALKILEGIIPGVKSKDPLFVIDKAITHLKLMKLEAESLGLGHSNPNGKLASFP
ncbi:transcription factor bHLH143-like [Primulina huaijiensis]|uniref:transcription factor bHLH143-like n=1 Tax=Primulina huaijiensis TaxID=1492673 RepID=UPI003CC711C4